jgi:hypothetical protein
MTAPEFEYNLSAAGHHRPFQTIPPHTPIVQTITTPRHTSEKSLVRGLVVPEGFDYILRSPSNSSSHWSVTVDGVLIMILMKILEV